MNKRITSLILCFVMVFAMFAAAVPALAAGSVDLKVTADKTEASPGDTITFTITLGPVSDMGSMQMDLVILLLQLLVLKQCLVMSLLLLTQMMNAIRM